MKKIAWPEWLNWEIEFTPNLLKRMEDRNFNESDLKKMLGRSTSYQADIVDGRWIIETQHRHHPWQVIVEPDEFERLLVIITAYPVWSEFP